MSLPIPTTFAGASAADANHYRLEALARLRAYQLITCQAELWDRALALLDLARDQVEPELAEEIGKVVGRMR